MQNTMSMRIKHFATFIIRKIWTLEKILEQERLTRTVTDRPPSLVKSGRTRIVPKKKQHGLINIGGETD